MKLKNLIKISIPGAALALVLIANPANAATSILSEDWQSPLVASGQRLGSTNGETNQGFTGWEFPDDNVFRMNHHSAGTTPQDGLSPNQALAFEWAGQYASYDTSQTWASADEFQVTLNATESSWSAASDRTVGIRIREVETDTILYTATAALPEYDAAHAGAGDSWNANQFFTFDFNAGDFAGGTEGNTLEFAVTNLDGRGMYVDNITFSLVPEPTTAALLGLGGLALILRRRR